MSDADLAALAEQAGIALRWRDTFGSTHEVAPDTLRAVLAAIGLPAQTRQDVHDGLTRLRAGGDTFLPPLVTGDTGRPVFIPAAPAPFRIALENGGVLEGHAVPAAGGATLPAIADPGYHTLEIGGAAATLAIAPPRCKQIGMSGGKPWGLATQLYSLRRAGDGGIGDFAALRDFARVAAARGASAVAISPVHAQFSADPDRFSPYAPSSRVALNVLHADAIGLLPGGLPPQESCGEHARLEALPLLDWPTASRARLTWLRRVYDAFNAAPPAQAHRDFAAFRASRPDIEQHALFEALHAHHFRRDLSQWHWRSWPGQYRDPRDPAVEAFARQNAAEVGFHAFAQFLADRSLQQAQATARKSGMSIGLISDLAVGQDGGGSHAWSRQDEMLIGLSVGAPPDLLSPQGQDWGLAAFSPRGMVRNGFGAFLEMLRAALRHAGGVRIDHVMGLARLWVLPEGAGATEGAYLHYPVVDLMRLVALESHRSQAIVLGEDLGTLPDGFQQVLDERGIMGLRVLWFEREGTQFRAPKDWSPGAVGMTSTHDLPTLAGWWRGHDLDTRKTIGLLGDDQGAWYEYENRARDRQLLWDACQASGAAQGPPPETTDAAPFVNAAIRHVGRSACALVMLPLEDVMSATEQPNLPGTLHEHPNWRRRFAPEATRLLDQPGVPERLDALAEARRIS